MNYTPRFMNGGEIRQGECALALDMDSPSSPTNTTPLNGGTTQQDGASALSGGNQTSRDGLGDSCERSMGEAAPIGVHSREDDRQKPCPSPNPFIVSGWYGMDDDGYSFACPPDSGVYIANKEQSERLYQEKLIRMGDASKEGSVACGAELVEIGQPPPAYTREELVRVMTTAIRNNYYGVPDSSITLCGEQCAALDALIALGAVRVK